jgi:carboxymethylenebutenolidase
MRHQGNLGTLPGWKIVEHKLSIEEHGVAGYIAYPERQSRGPALLLVHQYTGVTGYLKIEARKFAKLGYTTIIPALYDLLAHPAVTHIHLGRELQAQTSDAQFVWAIGEGWKHLLGRDDVDTARMAVAGYCMGGRIAIHFVAATPEVRAFVNYYPTVRDEPVTDMRPRTPWDAVADVRCPSIILYGADDTVTTSPIQERLWKAFLDNGQRLEWHYFPHGGHGFVDPDAHYEPHTAELAWALVQDFLARELENYSCLSS